MGGPWFGGLRRSKRSLTCLSNSLLARSIWRKRSPHKADLKNERIRSVRPAGDRQGREPVAAAHVSRPHDVGSGLSFRVDQKGRATRPANVSQETYAANGRSREGYPQ